MPPQPGRPPGPREEELAATGQRTLIDDLRSAEACALKRIAIRHGALYGGAAQGPEHALRGRAAFKLLV